MIRPHPLAPGAFDADVVIVEGSPRVRVRGELDLHTGAVLWAVSRPTIERVPPEGTLVIDLSALSFIDAAGIGVLVRLGNELGLAGKRLQVDAKCPTIRRVFEVTRLDAMLSMPALR